MNGSRIAGSAIGIIFALALGIHYWPILLICIGLAIPYSRAKQAQRRPAPRRTAPKAARPKAVPVHAGAIDLDAIQDSYPQAHYSNRR